MRRLTVVLRWAEIYTRARCGSRRKSVAPLVIPVGHSVLDIQCSTIVMQPDSAVVHITLGLIERYRTHIALCMEIDRARLRWSATTAGRPMTSPAGRAASADDSAADAVHPAEATRERRYRSGLTRKLAISC